MIASLGLPSRANLLFNSPPAQFIVPVGPFVTIMLRIDGCDKKSTATATSPSTTATAPITSTSPAAVATTPATLTTTVTILVTSPPTIATTPATIATTPP